jgi:hypothetical protein
METYTLNQAVEAGKLKKPNGKPYTNMPGVGAKLKEMGFHKRGFSSRGRPMFVLTEEDIATINKRIRQEALRKAR